MNTHTGQKRSGFKTTDGMFTKVTVRDAKPGHAAKDSSAQNIDQRETLTNGDPPKLMLWGSDE